MSRGLRVVAPGLLTTIQDLGRTGYQHLGIPPSGALDPVGLRAANLLAGNPPATGALEVLYFGPTLAVEADEVRLAFAGAAAAIDVLADARAPAGVRIEPMRSIRLKRGQAVRIGSLSGAAVLYVAAEGGFDIEPVLGSVSTYIRGGFGGLDGRALVQGDRLPLAGKPGPAQDDSRMSALSLKPPSRLRVIAGPQSDYFSERDMTSFFAGRYTVGAGSNRMGMRLEGPRVGHLRGFNITSDAIAPARSRCPATDSRSCCWRTGRRPAAIPRSRLSSPPICPRSAACRSVPGSRSIRCRSRPPRPRAASFLRRSRVSPAGSCRWSNPLLWSQTGCSTAT